MFTPKRILIAVVAIVILAVVMHLVTRNDKKDKPALGDDNPRENTAMVDSTPGIDWNLLDRENTYEIKKTRMIKEIIVEKQTVCAGEDFTVKVVANNTEGPNSELTYRIGTKSDNPAVMRYMRAGRKEIHVFVKNARNQVDHGTTSVTVSECPGKPIAIVRASLSNNRPEEAEIEVLELRGLEGKCLYEWDFGDGKTAKTNIKYVTHNYGDRNQKSFTTTFLVKVKVTDEAGRVATGRDTVTFPNIHWISNRMGRAILPVVYNRFPTETPEAYKVEMSIKNIYDQQVTFQNTDIETTPCAREEQGSIVSFNAGSLVTRTVLPPNGITPDVMVLSKKDFSPGTCNMKVTMNGLIGDGTPVQAELLLTIPMSPEKALETGRGKEVTDQELIRKIQKARKILGRELITPADIRKLEREGKL